MNIYSDEKDIIILFLIIIGVSAYYLWIRPSKCKNILSEYAKTQNGHLIKATKISLREDIYIVFIEIEGKSVKSIVEFSFSYKMTWL